MRQAYVAVEDLAVIDRQSRVARPDQAPGFTVPPVHVQPLEVFNPAEFHCWAMLHSDAPLSSAWQAFWMAVGFSRSTMTYRCRRRSRKCRCHPRPSSLSALLVGRLLANGLLLDLVLGDGALHSGEHTPARRGQVHVTADVGQLDMVLLGQVDEVLQLAGWRCRRSMSHTPSRVDQTVGDVPAQPVIASWSWRSSTR